MTYHPHDSLAKIILEKLTPNRETIPEAEMRVPIRGDVLLRPGPALPEWTGLLGTLAGTSVTVLEFYHGRPRAHDLLRARAKGTLACALETEKNPRFDGTSAGRVLVIMIGQPRQARRRAYRSQGRTAVAPGHQQLDDSPQHIHLDLLRLRVTLETAWLHVAGNSPSMEEALGLLAQYGVAEVQSLLSAIRQEMSFMPTIQNTIPDRDDNSGALRFLKAWERVQIKLEGIQEGESKGRLAGKLEGVQKGATLGKLEEARRALLVVTTARFGTPDASFSDALLQLEDLECLEDLLRVAAVASSFEEVKEQVEAALQTQ